MLWKAISYYWAFLIRQKKFVSPKNLCHKIFVSWGIMPHKKIWPKISNNFNFATRFLCCFRKLFEVVLISHKWDAHCTPGKNDCICTKQKNQSASLIPSTLTLATFHTTLYFLWIKFKLQKENTIHQINFFIGHKWRNTSWLEKCVRVCRII